MDRETCSIDVVILDFGGVLAEKGFEEGLRAIAVRHGFDELDLAAWIPRLHS